jgi:acid phosphatase (class A)
LGVAARAMTFAVIAASLAGASAAKTPNAHPAARPAQDASMGPPKDIRGYLPAGALDGAAVLGPPPAPDSPHGRADRAVYEETRRLEGSARWKQAIADNDLWAGGALERFSCALGKSIDGRQTPTALKMLQKLEADVRGIGTPAKQHFDRKRPALGNDLPICVPREDWLRTNASYPSGHSMTVWAWALVLTEAAPDRAEPLLKAGRESGESRVVCGVHFPSDIEAGRTLSAGMVAKLHTERSFTADLAKAKREIAAAKATPKRCEVWD